MLILMHVHLAFHLARWGIRGEMSLNVTTECGRSGWIAFLMTWAVVIVMALPERFRPVLKWEVRMLVHRSALVAYLALAWHSPKCAYYYLFTLLVFILDKLGILLFCQHKIEAATITNVGYGTVLSFDTPTSWKMADGYICVCLPWISKTQWHPFSFYPVSTAASFLCCCVSAKGP